jgi:secreted PhoX family phosphatase
VWRFVPDGDAGGKLSLVFESPAKAILDSPDNICVGPGGGIFICEDGSAEQFIRVLTPDGAMANLVMQPVVDGVPEPDEFAGCCFSPDGSVLFFNVQGSTVSYGTRWGGTYAMWGDWGRVGRVGT